MKKILIAIFISFFTLSTSTFAIEAATIQPDTKNLKTTSESSEAKKSKIVSDLRTTIDKLSVILVKTKTVIELFEKNKRNTFEASKFLLDSQNSLDTANLAFDQFLGVTNDKDMKPVFFKDPLKKTEESMKDSKASLILSITALKDSLSPKE